MSDLDDLNPAEKALQNIITNSKCPVCSGAIERNMGSKYFARGMRLEWRCKNQKCDESTHWNLTTEHRKWEGGER